jgi:uncharacterized protein DUF11
MSMARSVRFLILLSLSLVLIPAAHADGKCTSTIRVCLEVTSPDTTVSAGGWTRYSVTLSNNGPNQITHASITMTAANGTPYAPLPASCSASGSALTCDAGTVASGGPPVTLTDVVFAAGSQPGQTLTTVASFDNGASDPDPGRQDTLPVSTVASAPAAGSAITWVPANAGADLATVDPAQTISAHLPPQSSAITAQLGKDANPKFACPKSQVCRLGDWDTASVPFAFAGVALQFRLHWAPALVSKKQTVKNFVVYHLNDNGVLEQISRTCSSPAPSLVELPCLGGVKVGAGGADATLFTTHNGRMR